MEKLIFRTMFSIAIFFAGYMYSSGKRQIVLSEDSPKEKTEKVETVLARGFNPSFDFDEFLKLRWLNVTVEKNLNEIVVNAKQIDWSRPRFKINGIWDTTPDSQFIELEDFEKCPFLTETEFDIYVKAYWTDAQS